MKCSHLLKNTLGNLRWCSLEGCSQEKPFIVGRSKKQKVELGGSAVTEQLTVDGRSFSYQQLEGSFSQPNAGEALGRSWLKVLLALPPVSGAHELLGRGWCCNHIALHGYKIVLSDTMGTRWQLMPILTNDIVICFPGSILHDHSLQYLHALPAVRSRSCMGIFLRLMSRCHLNHFPKTFWTLNLGLVIPASCGPSEVGSHFAQWIFN